MDREFSPLKTFTGSISPAGDHNIALVSALAASLAQGETVLERFPAHRECQALLQLLRRFGVETEYDAAAAKATIRGSGLSGWNAAQGEIDIAGSETLLKLISGAVAGRPFTTTLTGSAFFSLVPMAEIIEPLGKMGARLQTEDDHLPFVFLSAQLQAAEFELSIMDANTKAALLLAGLRGQGTTRIIETLASSDHLERALLAFGAGVRTDKAKPDGGRKDEDELERRIRMAKARQDKKTGETGPPPAYRVEIDGGSPLQGRSLAIPGDITVAASLAVLTCLARKSELKLEAVGFNTIRNAAFGLLRRMGAEIEITNKRAAGEEPVADLTVKSSKLQGRKFNSEEMVNCIDEVPAIAVAAAFAEGRTVIRNIERLRSIDADCVTAVTENLRRMGVRVGELPDGLVIDGDSGYKATEFDSRGDSRVAMAFAVAGLRCAGTSILRNADPAEADFPEFFSTIDRLRDLESAAQPAGGG